MLYFDANSPSLDITTAWDKLLEESPDFDTLLALAPERLSDEDLRLHGLSRDANGNIIW